MFYNIHLFTVLILQIQYFTVSLQCCFKQRFKQGYKTKVNTKIIK